MNKTLTIQFLTFEGCPLADATREVLEQALAVCGLDRSSYEDIDILLDSTPEKLKAFGSPSIVVNGKDVTGNPSGNAASCRIYDGPNGAPSLDSVVSALQQHLQSE